MYLLAAGLVAGRTVLDVGAGTGYGIPILEAGQATLATGIDPKPMGPKVTPLPLQCFRDSSFDILTCIDVLEHVENDAAFLDELARVAKLAVFIATPNYDVWHCESKYHFREYTPEELKTLLGSLSYMSWTCGANRIEKPLHLVPIEETESTFGILVRAPTCTDEEWTKLFELAATADMDVTRRLTSLTKWAAEWTSEANVQILGIDPLEDQDRLVDWARFCLRDGIGNTYTDAAEILRFGVASPKQKEIVLEWLWTLLKTRWLERKK